MSDNMKQYDFMVLIGRFQPLHNGHIEVIDKALEVVWENGVLVRDQSFAEVRSLAV